GRAAHGLDKLDRHEAATASFLRQQARGHRLLRARRHCLSSVREQATEAPAHRLFRQFLLRAARFLDALRSRSRRDGFKLAVPAWLARWWQSAAVASRRAGATAK